MMRILGAMLAGMLLAFGAGSASGQLDSTEVIQLQVTGQSLTSPTGAALTVPDVVSAVSLNVTVVNPARPGFVTVYPCTVQRPLASNLNYVAGDVVPNGVIAPVGATGKVCFYSSASTDIVVDIAGWFAGDSFVGASPLRLVDTRNGTGAPAARINNAAALPVSVVGQSVSLPDGSTANVPASASAVALNVPVVNPSRPGFVTVYPCDAARPVASNVNFVGGQIVANGVVAPLGASGDICFFSSADTDIVVDIAGWFGGDSFTGATPNRLVDTRNGTGGFSGEATSAVAKPGCTWPDPERGWCERNGACGCHRCSTECHGSHARRCRVFYGVALWCVSTSGLQPELCGR